MKLPFDAVMLIGFGGPTRPEEIRPFLDAVLRDRPVGAERYEEVVRHYERIGGRSPYNELTLKQAASLARSLSEEGISIPVLVGMRNWPPYIRDVLARLSGRGARRVLGLIMSAFQCEASWERYQRAVDKARAALGADAPTVEYVESWHGEPLFVEALAARVVEALEPLGDPDRHRALLLFTAHSIPVAMAARAPYVEQLMATAAKVAKTVGIGDWKLAFQSRGGNPSEPWLEPDVADVMNQLAGRTVVVVPVGFLCDHVEVLYDLDVAAAETARGAGVRMLRAATVGDHPAFIRLMTSAVRCHLEVMPSDHP